VDFDDGAFEDTCGIDALDLPMAKGMGHDLDEIEHLGVGDLGEIGQELLDSGFKRFVLAFIGRRRARRAIPSCPCLHDRQHDSDRRTFRQ
jgi:hypothetical protein